jgi:alpha-glucosidase
MFRSRLIVFFLLLFLSVSTAYAQDDAGLSRIESPNGAVSMMLLTRPGANGGLHYIVEFHGKRVLDESVLGLKFEQQPPLGSGMKQTSVKTTQADETYSIPVGKTSTVRDHYNAIRADFEDDNSRKLTVEMRAYDDGIAFRMIVPDQPAFKHVRLERELTEFVFSKDATTYPLVLDGYQSSYEDDYQMRPVSGLHKDWLVGLPLLADIPGVAWVGITEADIENYAGMYLRKSDERFALRAQLAPRIDHPSVAVETDAPVTTPWRVLMIGDEPGRLIESNVILNLNPPSRIADTAWIKAGKTSWDWWSGDFAANVSFTPGMNTATLKHYIDFSAASGFPYMLIDAGWALANRKSPSDYAAVADITKFDPAVDMPELLRYAKEKNVKLWVWSHWTSIDKYMDQAFPLFEQWGIAGVKIDFMNRDDQQMVAWYRRVVDLAAQHHLMIDFHGAFKPDGLRRTYPNLLTREGVMGKEYLKWSARTSPVHNTTLPFTRMLAGPLDYTPGAFGNSNRENFIARNTQPMGLGTRAHELALYVILESPLQMVSDYPERYAGQHDFEFIRQVPATWDEVRVLTGRPMENITIARRSGKDWYIGSITNWDARTVPVPLDFLGEGKYTAEIYADASDAATDATHTTFATQPVDKSTVLEVKMVSGGGNAIWIHPAL